MIGAMFNEKVKNEKAVELEKYYDFVITAIPGEDYSIFKSKEQGDAHQVREVYFQVCSSTLLHLTPFLILSQISTTRQSLAGLSSSPPCTLCWLPWPATTGAWSKKKETVLKMVF